MGTVASLISVVIEKLFHLSVLSVSSLCQSFFIYFLSLMHTRAQVLHLRQLQGKIQLMDLKAKVTHFNLKRKIYTPKRIKALKVVRYELDKKITACEKVSFG